MAFSNPVPVAVALVPYKGKLVGLRRGIEPRKGQIALPGGYINAGESYQAALSRELFEETGVSVPEKAWEVFHVGVSVESNRILIFGRCREIENVDLNYKCEETEEIFMIDSMMSLAFPLHEEARDKFYALKHGEAVLGLNW
jgi:ADP-ribose pyrophosphatase YjhB (NUDIX family)